MAATTTSATAAQENGPTILRNKPSALVKPLPCSKTTTMTDRQALAGVVNQQGPVTRRRGRGRGGGGGGGGGARQTRARRTASTRGANRDESSQAETAGTQGERRDEEEGQQQRAGRGRTRTAATRAPRATTSAHNQPNNPPPDESSHQDGTTKRPLVTVRTNTTRQTTAAGKKTREPAQETGAVGVNQSRVAGAQDADTKTNGCFVTTRSRKSVTTTTVARGMHVQYTHLKTTYTGCRVEYSCTWTAISALCR